MSNLTGENKQMYWCFIIKEKLIFKVTKEGKKKHLGSQRNFSSAVSVLSIIIRVASGVARVPILNF